jgi:hypothetical protein
MTNRMYIPRVNRRMLYELLRSMCYMMGGVWKIKPDIYDRLDAVLGEKESWV